MTQRYVATRDILAAVKGRETDVLDALGIEWRAGRPHLRCPYQAHSDDNASWRWDATHAKARCTCTKGDSIFDVLAKTEGRDFESAKVRVAEILSRGDLIRTKANLTSGPKYQSTDAPSLLSAPTERRDDSLPVAYLAYRLGVPVDAVPIPSTQMIGLKALGYYDPPPPGSKAKPKLVGEFPGAVFATIGADGRGHAHRIYVAAGGAGKADLGTGQDGRPRNPKKSAKITGSDNIAGRSVLWGAPGHAPHIIVTEGIENGAAVALALLAEIKAGEIAVASAISATGIEAFETYPATARVTIAADRDEAPKDDGRPGSRRGEQAARGFGLRHHERIKVAIALPGAAGETVDWLDVLARDGVAAVHDGILRKADPFVPAQKELEAAAQNRNRAAELERLAADYPLPMMDTMTLRYAHTSSGRVKVHKLIGWEEDPDTGSKKPLLIPIATPFGVPARLRHVDQADAYGLRCLVQDMDGKPREINFDRGTLPRMGATDIRSMLFAAGLRTEGDGEMVVLQCLKAADPVREIIVVRRSGWHEIAGLPESIFVCPNGDVIGAPKDLDLELAASARLPPDVAKAGTSEGWRAAIEAALSISECEHWILGILAPFAGPVVALTGLDTSGINLSGLSTSGKSLAQRLAASVWSTPDIRRRGLFQSARATDNAVEALAERASGTVLALDELAHVSGKLAAKMIYTIASGVGKQRMTADASLRSSYTWSTFAILSGECSLEEKVRGDGGDWVAGMAVRIVDIDVEGVNRNVSAETLRRINDIENHHGHAGPAFVCALIENGAHRQAAALRDRILKAARNLAGGDTADSATIRAATPLALLLIAGELAKSFDLIPADTAVKEAVTWAWGRFKQSSDAAALDPETQMIANLRQWIAERWDVTIKPVDAGNGVNNREALAWYDDDSIYIPKDRIREAAGKALKRTEIGAVLDRRGLLAVKPAEDRFCVRWVPNIGKVAAYALSRKEFGRSTATKDPNTFTVYGGGRQ